MRVILFILVVLCNVVAAQVEEPFPNVNSDELYETDFLPPSFHKGRRDTLRKLMPKNSVAIFFSNPVRNRSNDINFEYHQDPNFYYLTGFNEPNAVFVLFSEAKEINDIVTEEILFVPQRDPKKEVWDGKRLGLLGALTSLGIKTIMLTDQFKDADFNFDKDSLITYSMSLDGLEENPFKTNDLFHLQAQFEHKLENVDQKNIKREEYTKWTDQLREVKTEEELDLMRKAIDITCKAQIELLKAIEPGMTEYQSEAIIEFIFKLNGAEYPGFSSIQGSGENSCILHYITNRKKMLGRNLLVSDVGAEYHGYTADVTRTMPVDGQFSEEEKAIYNIVLEAQNAGIEACKVGNDFWAPHVATTTIISQRLKALGIISTPLELKKYFMHGTSHYLGLDVHDFGTYEKLQSNTVITVEPGIYIPEGSPCDKKWWNIGVRIEDDILITEKGPENLSDCIPRTTEEIEEVMKEKSFLSN